MKLFSSKEMHYGCSQNVADTKIPPGLLYYGGESIENLESAIKIRNTA